MATNSLIKNQNELKPSSESYQAAESTSNNTPGLDIDFDSKESGHNDNDSAMEESFRSSKNSTSSSVSDFVEENGRTYHRYKEGKYYLPNDDTEKDRLNLQHHVWTLLLESLYLAPLDDLEGGLHNALDIATGTGIWAIEFAEKFPDTAVIATDLSPIQPNFCPPNLQFEIDDCEDPWVYPNKFDYIHGRMLVTCFQSHLTVFKSAFDSLRSGGYIEIQDGDFEISGMDEKIEGTALQKWPRLLAEAATALGKDWGRVPTYKSLLKEAGFVDIVARELPLPIGPWAKGKKNKTLGTWHRSNVLQAVQGLSMAVLTRGLGMTAQEVDLLLVDVKNDINKDGAESLHAYATLRVVYGRKP